MDRESEHNAIDIEDSCPLPPIQQGMLFNTLPDPGSGVVIEQLRCNLHETADVAAFKRAWTCVMTCHPALRTNLLWENLIEPAQVELSWEEQPLQLRWVDSMMAVKAVK